MLAAWCDVFASGGLSGDELLHASRWLAAHAPPKYPSEHLRALRERVLTQRREAKRAEEAEYEPGRAEFDHATCGGSGWVIVPHMRSVVHGRWVEPFYTCAVACDCSRGMRIYHAQAEHRRPLRIGQYSLNNPDWERQVSERQRHRHAVERADRLSAQADDQFRAKTQAAITKLVRAAADDGSGTVRKLRIVGDTEDDSE